MTENANDAENTNSPSAPGIEPVPPEPGTAPERPRIRRLTNAEVEQWSKGIHKVCEDPPDAQKSGSGKRGWVPQLRSAFAHLMPFVDEACPTAYTDCRYRIGLGPHLLDPEQTSLEQLAFVILHETMHNTQHHRDRLIEKRGLNQKLVNFATDLEINGIIAEGVFGISLSRPESPLNGNWDYLIGEFKQLNDKQAKEINEATAGPDGKPGLGRLYAGGDWFYQGGLFPSHGQFHDFPTNMTAEQYLGMLECEVEEMTVPEFFAKQKQERDGIKAPGDQENDGASAPSDGDGKGAGDEGGGYRPDGVLSRSIAGPSGGQDEGGSTSQSNGTDMSMGGGSGGEGVPVQGTGGAAGGASGMGSTGEGSGTGSGSGVGDGSDAGDDGSNGTNGAGTGNGAGAAGCAGGFSGTAFPATGSTRGGGADPGNGEMSDGYGGNAQDTGDGHVQVTHIYKRNADGSRTEVGRDALVDDIGSSMDSDVWKQVSGLGIDPITRGEEQKVRDQIAHDIEVFRRSNGYGTQSGDLMLNYIERGLRPPVVNWKKVLRASLSRACQEQAKGRDDFTYRKINRRYSNERFIFPGMTSYVPTIRLALDTSGSMSAEEYYNAISEAEGILKVTKAKIQFCCWDGDVSEVKRVRTIKEIKTQLLGGGGTVPSCVCEGIDAEKQSERPDVLVVATDGCFEWEPFAQSLASPAMQKIIPIVIVVYHFTEERFYAMQGDLVEHQKLLRKYHRKAQVLQAWARK